LVIINDTARYVDKKTGVGAHIHTKIKAFSYLQMVKINIRYPHAKQVQLPNPLRRGASTLPAGLCHAQDGIVSEPEVPPKLHPLARY